MGHSLGSKRASRKAAPSPSGGQVEVGRGQNPSLRIRSQAAAAWLNSKEAPSAPALREWRPGYNPPTLRPQAPKQTSLPSAGARSGNERHAAGWALAGDTGGSDGEGGELGRKDVEEREKVGRRGGEGRGGGESRTARARKGRRRKQEKGMGAAESPADPAANPGRGGRDHAVPTCVGAHGP